MLDEFESRHERETLRISINTLGPDDDEDLTNRIQKELVKQLVYRAKPGQVRRSRFARSAPLTRLRALADSVMITSVGLSLLWLLGLWPRLTRHASMPDAVADIVLPAVFVLLVVMVVWAARWLTGNRIVSQFATAGTAVTLDDKPDTYFDKFLDEIMAFFDAVRPKFVIFEDLDRFDDPQIFDSLRELNTLINSSAGKMRPGSRIARVFRRGWRSLLRALNAVTLKKITKPRFTAALTREEPQDEPVRFIFAIKDSLFEKLGVDLNKPEPPADGAKPDEANLIEPMDVAANAVERANRTKFFELVIPVVPFISHRNARDLLIEAIDALGLSTDLVTRTLLDLVARHTTDMRLMINICNEFAVFAEHLLWVPNSAPGMTADDLFALVAYKNFHLADFEDIAQRTSSLDTLEQHHRTLVRESIEQLQAKKRALRTTNDLQQTQDKTATTLGKRLIAYKDSLPRINGYAYQNVIVSNEPYPFSAASESTFWRQVVEAGAISMSAPYASPIAVNRDTLEALFPEAMDTFRWRVPSSSDWARERKKIDEDIRFLRGADFDDLARRTDFGEERRTFNQLVSSTLPSELARDLVRKGFINRNFAEYSAKFYGSFIGVDVAFFYNHSVQPNVMYIDHQFETPGSVKNLLEQVPADFTSTVSVLNLQVVSYLLTHDTPAARRVAAFIASDFGSDAATFLDAFLNETSAPRPELVGLLAAHPWRDVFYHLATNWQIPDEASRIELLDAALLSARPTNQYTLSQDTRALLEQSYPQLSAFTHDQSDDRTKTVFSFAEDAELIIADLGKLGIPLRRLVVGNAMYELTTHNLRIALRIADSPTVERVRLDERVWRYCQENIDQYLSAIRDDEHTKFAVTTHQALSEVITEQHAVWTDEQLRALLDMSPPDAALPDLTMVPVESWPMVLDANRVVPTIANVWTYVDANGIDTSMARFLAPQGIPIQLTSDENTDIETTTKLAIQVLNSSAIPTAARVRLATGVGLLDRIQPTELTPTKDDLLARALEAKLLPDSLGTFEHFIAAGWEPVSEAFAVSANVDDFLTPTLVAGVVAQLINDPQVPDSIRDKVVSNLADYVGDDDDEPALRAAGEYARNNNIKLEIEQVQRIARTTRNPDLVVGQLTRNRNATAEQILETLVLLGPPYTGLGNGAGHEFDLPPGSSNKTIFERLEKDGKVELVKKGVRGGRRVRNLV